MTAEHFEEAFKPPSIEDPTQINQYPLLKLKFNKLIAYRVYDEFDESDISLDNIIVSIQMPEEMWLYALRT